MWEPLDDYENFGLKTELHFDLELKKCTNFNTRSNQRHNHENKNKLAQKTHLSKKNDKVKDRYKCGDLP